MENASKALIIAGAILLAIAIIGVGMYVYQMAAAAINQQSMSAQEVDAYNSEFVKYEGIQNGSTVRAMLNTINTHNLTNKEDLSKQIITAAGTATGATVGDDSAAGTTSAEIATQKAAVVSGTRYKVTFDYTSTGLIKTINYAKQN